MLMGTESISCQANRDLEGVELSSVKLFSRAFTQRKLSGELIFFIGWSKGKSIEKVTMNFF